MGKAKSNDSQIPWAQWQRHDEAAEAYFRTKARGNPGATQHSSRDTNIIKVKNNSGGDRSAGHILEFTGFALDAPTSLDIPLIWMTGGSPTLANGFGVLLRPTPSTEIDDCQVAGSCFALVNVTNASHKYARVASATYVLQSSITGPVKILYSTSTGEQLCPVLLCYPARRGFKATADEDIAAGAAGDVILENGFTVEATNISSVEWSDGNDGWADAGDDWNTWKGTPAECP